MSYHVLAFYCITPLDNPHELIKEHVALFKTLDIKSRIYISEDGINGQMSASPEASIIYQNWLKTFAPFKEIEFKIHQHNQHPFPRQIVKYRKKLVAIDCPIDFGLKAAHISTRDWKEMLESRDENTLVIDVRNRYESKVGYFEGSELPQVDTFREFAAYTEVLKAKTNLENTKVYMCCTGGIRCELFSAHMKKEGFKNVAQLDGGIIKYGLEQGNKHFKGKLYVFDDRMVVPISNDPTETVGECQFCKLPSDNYYNCANTDCNNLFLSCTHCIEKEIGCCQEDCKGAPRLRIFDKNHGAKPFKKAYLYRHQFANV